MNERNVRRKISGNGIVALRLAAACAALLCLVAASAWAQSASPAPPNMLGVWQGFSQSYPPDPVFPPEPVVPVRSEVSLQENRRISGLMQVGIIQPCVLTFNGNTADKR